jgi:hypothetical protein
MLVLYCKVLLLHFSVWTYYDYLIFFKRHCDKLYFEKENIDRKYKLMKHNLIIHNHVCNWSNRNCPYLKLPNFF